MTRRLLPTAAVPTLAVLTLLAVAACGSDDSTTAETGDAASVDAGGEASMDPDMDMGECTPDAMETLTAGTLTWGTSEPAYKPWVVDNDPTNGEGYESAVAAAVSEHLGFETTEWVRGTFDTIIAPGAKDFDVALNQVSINEERAQAVDFSSSYYDVRQAVIAVEGNPAASATSLADLKDVRLGAQVGTTSLAAIAEQIAPTTEAAAYNSNEDAKLALSSGQVDAIVLDLPSAFFVTAVEIEGGVIIGQLPQADGEVEQFGLVLDLGSPLTPCLTQAVDALRADGTLAELEAEWLSDAGAPELT